MQWDNLLKASSLLRRCSHYAAVGRWHRSITTKQPTKSTAPAPKPAQFDDLDEDTIHGIVVPAPLNKSSNTEGPQKQRWQSTETVTKVLIEKRTPVHTCETLEDYMNRNRDTYFKYSPNADDGDDLPVHEWRGFFHLFTQSKGLAMENVQLMRAILGLEGSKLREYNRNRKRNNDLMDQLPRPKRLEMLGHDLAAAHFLVFREGRVRFHGHQDWIYLDDDDDDDGSLGGMPNVRTEGMLLKEVDLTRMRTLLYEGLENLDGCEVLESMNLSGLDVVDNFFLDRVCSQHHGSLRRLDISHCNNVSVGGITALVRLRKLEQLNVTGLKLPHLTLACLSLQDELPGLQLLGLQEEQQQLDQQEVDSVHARLSQLDTLSVGAASSATSTAPTAPTSTTAPAPTRTTPPAHTSTTSTASTSTTPTAPTSITAPAPTSTTSTAPTSTT